MGVRVIDRISAFVDWPATPDARYSLLGHTHAIYALLSHAHAGEDITSGTVADARIATSLSGKTLVTPTIASFVNAQHNHSNAAGGGTISGGGGTPGGSVGQVQVHGAGGVFAGDAGFSYDATTDAATLAGGVITGKLYPPANSDNAFGLYRANGTTQDFRYDSINGRILAGSGAVVAAPFGVRGAGNTSATNAVVFQNSDSLTMFQMVNNGNIVHGGTTVPQTRYSMYSAGRVDFKLYPAASTVGNIGFYGNGGDFGSAYGEFGFLSEASNQVASINFDTRSGVAPFRFFVAPAGGAQMDAIDIFSNGYVGIGTSNVQATALFQIAASTAARASLRMRSGVAPTSPNDGDLWYATRLAVRRGATTETVATGVTGAAITQTYNTAARTVNAYTTDAEAAYTGQDNAQVGNVYAKYADLEALRVAYTNLEAGHLNLLQVVTALIDDAQAFAISG